MRDGCIYWWQGLVWASFLFFHEELCVMNEVMPGPLFLLRATRNVTSPRTVRDKYRDTLVIVIPNSHRAVNLMMKSGAGN